MKDRAVGTWRSYKVFYYSGRVEKHNDAVYVEISVDPQGRFTALHSQNKRAATAFSPEHWRIEQLKKRWFIYLGKKQAYEIITLEPDDMVLLDIVKGEKFFFSKMPGWQQRIEPAVTSKRHIHPGSAQQAG